jgi:hypothetical protein
MRSKKLKIVDSVYLVWLGVALAATSALLGWEISDNQSGPAAFISATLIVLLVHIIFVIREVTRD